MLDIPGDVNTIDEFLALVDLEPSLQYVFVEGRTDAIFYNWYLESIGLDLPVSAVSDRLYIPRHDLPPVGDEYGEREKLNVLAERVSSRLAQDQKNVTVIMDADWSSAVGPQPIEIGCRLMTDFPSLEFYFIEPGPFDRFSKLGLGVSNVDYDLMRAAIDTALVQVGSARLVLKLANIACIAGFADLCVVTPNKSEANVREILKRSIDKVDRSHWPADLIELVEWAQGFEEMLKFAGHRGRGHDIAPLLIKFFKLKNKDFTPLALERLMRLTADLSELSTYPLFRSLGSRLLSPN